MSAVPHWIAAQVAPWLAVLAIPLGVAALLFVRRLRPLMLALAPWAALPALLFALLAPAGAAVDVPWLLLGTHLGLDETTRVFFFFTALVWLLTGVYARGYLQGDAHTRGFFAYHLLAMTGNLGLILAADVASFYASFALMSYAAYGLVVHDRSRSAVRAGRVYIVLTVLGEMLLFSGLMLTVADMTGLSLAEAREVVARSERRGLILILLVSGLGVKAGALPLHVWLPLAHPVAPTPASAALSGLMIKAGLVGWLQLLPLGHVALAGAGVWGMAGGVLAAFYGVAIGLTQRDPKTILAYSSISQMGLLTVAVGVGLAAPDMAPGAVLAATVFALHHALAKSALFLGVGVVQRRSAARWRWLLAAGMAVPIAALAGLPLTSGAVAKAALKEALDGAPGAWASALGVLVSLASAGTLLLLLRLAEVLRDQAGEHAEPAPRSMWSAWAVTTLAAAVLVWVLPWAGIPRFARQSVALSALWSSVWPALVGLGVAGGVHALRRRRALPALPEIPAGDLVVPLERGVGRGRARVAPVGAWARGWAARAPAAIRPALASMAQRGRRALAVEDALISWTVAMLLFAGLLGALVAAIALP